MPAAERGHGLVGRALVALLVVALVLGGVAAWRLDLAGHLTDDDDPSAGTPAGPAAVPPPEGLELPALTEPAPVDTPATAPGRIEPTLVEAAVAPYLADPTLGKHVVGAVADLTAGRPVVKLGDGVAAMPASVTKLLTTTAALSVLGPETRFSTRVVAGGKNRIVLVGGGDPFLSSKPLPSAYPDHADLRTLAAQTATALQQQGRTSVQLGYDDSLFSEPSFNPAWPAHYLPEHVVSRVTALWVDEGRPAVGFGAGRRPVAVRRTDVRRGPRRQGHQSGRHAHHGVASDGRELASVQSAPLRELVARILEVSDNEGAEVISHQVGKAVTGSGTFADGAAAVTQTLRSLGVTADFDIHDGSGLSRENRIEPLALVQVLRLGVRPGPPRARRDCHRASRGRLQRLADQPVRPAVPRLARPGAGQDRDAHQREQPGRHRGGPGRPPDAVRTDGRRDREAERDQGPACPGRSGRRARRVSLRLAAKPDSFGRLRCNCDCRGPSPSDVRRRRRGRPAPRRGSGQLVRRAPAPCSSTAPSG